MRKIVLFMIMLMSLLTLPVVMAQQNDNTDDVPVPQEVDTALADLSDKLDVTLDQDTGISAFRWERQDFPDTSLGCPQPDMMYAQVITTGYIIEIDYRDVTYDYRVSEGGESVILCSPPADQVTSVIEVTPEVIDITPLPEVTADAQAQVDDTPNVAIAPDSGQVGTLVQVRAINFPADTPVVLGIGEVASEYTIIQNLVSNGLGEVPAEFTLPDTFVPGTQLFIVVETEDLATEAISVPFTVLGEPTATATLPDATQTPIVITATPAATVAPDIALPEPDVAIFPVRGVPGIPVQVIVNDFPPNTSVVIGLGEETAEYDVVRTARTDRNGALFTQFILPENYDGGEELRVVVETDDLLTEGSSTAFTVLDENFTGDPVVTLDPITGAVGDTLILTASGFPANTSVIIGVGELNSVDFEYSLREITDEAGNLTMDITIPEDAAVDRPYVVLVEVEEDRDFQAISDAFTPTGIVPTPLPEGAEFNQADIYLVAVGAAAPGDDGFLGCSDLVVPVTVQLEPTIAPLGAVLDELLGLENRLYGQSGLYNALYQSTLNVDSINIEDGLATINLTGTLILNGVCDTPRVDAQIRETALQFSTVDAVEIFLNGQPLADILLPDNDG